MNIKRNDQCICGSGKKFKNCCISKSSSSKRINYIRLFIISVVCLLIAFSVYGLYESFDYPEQEYYKCDNPNCNQLHKRPISSTSNNTDTENN